MKRKLSLVLLSVIVLLSVVGCGSDESTEMESSSEMPSSEVQVETEESQEPVTENLEGTLEEIVASIYENATNEMALGPVTPITLTSPDEVKYMLGLDNVEGVVEAVTSEAMMSAVAYSLALVKVEEGADIEAIKTEIHEGVDSRKWICVEAEKVIVTNSGDVILMIMTEADMADSIVEAFTTVANGSVGETLTRSSIAE